MKKIHYIYVCLGLLLSVFRAQAASEAEFGKLEKTYTLHADGSQEMRVCKELTLFTHAAMNGFYGETFIVYNPAWQELKIHEAYTRQKDGTIVPVPQNARVEVLPSAAVDAPAYNGWREMVVVHTGLELGATICLDYSVVTRAGYLPALDVCTQVEEASPIRRYVCSISVPEDRPLNYTLVNGNTAPLVKNEGGRKTVTWTLNNVAAYYPAESHAALAGNVQVILAHSYSSAADALQVLHRQFTASQEPEVAALAQKLTEGKQPAEKEKVLKTYVDGLGNCRLSLADAGYRLRPASEVIRTAYGTRIEKMNLLAGLLKAAGLPAEVKIAYGVKADERCLGLSAVADVFLQSSAVAAMQDFQPVLNLEGKAVKLASPAAVVCTDTLAVTAETGETLAGGYRVITLPRASEGIAAQRYGRAGGGGCANLLLPFLPDETYTCLIRLPESMQVCTPLDATRITNRVGTLHVTFEKSGNTLSVVRSLKLNKQFITPADYEDFRRLIAEWEDPRHTTVLLKAR